MLCWPYFLWFTARSCPRALALPLLPGCYGWSGESVGGRQGRWPVWGQYSIPECPASLVVSSPLLKSAGPFKYFMQRRRKNL